MKKGARVGTRNVSGLSEVLSTASSEKENHKPWLHSKSRKKADRRIHLVFTLISMIFGFGSIFAIFLIAYLESPTKHKYCLVLDEQFDGTEIDTSIWTFEQQTSGWSSGEFEWTTNSSTNSYVKDGSLYIVPTLTSDTVGAIAVLDGYTLNLTATGQCTSHNASYCVATSNISSNTILPPIQSAKLTTKLSGIAIQYGKVEITARMPTGNWIWPSIYMLPIDPHYGDWPASGQIDIFNSKGNPSRDRNDGLSSAMVSTLHWGPLPILDMYKYSTNVFSLFQNFWNNAKHTFGMVWDNEGIVTWQRTRAYEVFNYKFGKGTNTFWNKGNFPQSLSNGTILQNPWTTSDGINNPNAAPFDQEFYLTLSVAVGSTNGYFSDWDAVHGKPWSDASENPTRDFWESRNSWLPSWPKNAEDRAMIVDSVKIWQQC